MVDTAIFVGILILATTYIYIESVKSSADLSFVQENEDINERAIRTLEALVQGSAGGLEVYSIQPHSMVISNNPVSRDLRHIRAYLDICIEVLGGMEDEPTPPDSYEALFVYVDARMDDLRDYLGASKDILSEVRDSLNQVDSGKDAVCDLVSELGKLLGSFDTGLDCNGGFDFGFLDDLSGALASASSLVNDVESAIKENLRELGDSRKSADDALKGVLHSLACELARARELTNTHLNYFEVGLDMRASLLDLWPARANLESLTIGDVIRNALLVKGDLASTDNPRALVAAAGLLALRDKDIGFKIPGLGISKRNMSFNGVMSRNETVMVLPVSGVSSFGPNSVVGPYHELYFGGESYLTGARELAVRLKVYGDGIPGEKHKTNYFEDMEYILSTPAYSGSSHSRRYNGTFINGSVLEKPVAVRNSSGTEASDDGFIIKRSRRETITLVRPMVASLVFTYENLTWPSSEYGFDVLHIRETSESNYTIYNGTEGDDEDATNSVLLGFALASRSDLRELARQAVEERLDDLLGGQGYKYKFRAEDCCGSSIEVNTDLEPVGRVGISKSYFMVSGGNRGEMELYVWRG